MKIGHGLIAHLNFVCEVYAAGVGSKQSVTHPTLVNELSWKVVCLIFDM